MSKLGIIFVYVALAGALASGVLGWMLIQKYSTSQTSLNQIQTSLTAEQSKVKKAQKDAEDAKAAKDQSDAQLQTANTQIDTDKTQLAAAQKAQDDLNTQLTQAKTDAKKAQDDLAQVNTDLGGMSAADAKAKMTKDESDLAAAQSQEKILQDQLQASQKQIVDLQDAINRAKVGTIPPGVSGKVTFVNRAWNFVVLNIGLSNGVVPNGELIVYRGRDFLGKVRITSAEQNTSVADILPDAKADIQIGDDVLN
jgi:multidrug efflux pump subunit AcrA (membrane-fusion protein)